MNHPEQNEIDAIVRLALEEDIGTGDLTASLIPEDATAAAHVIAKESAVICGMAWFDTVYSHLDNQVRIDWEVNDGDYVAPGEVLCRLNGRTRSLLTGERSALNLLQTLSGTATTTRHYVQRIRGTKARIYDTRKTLPGLRSGQKYAVRCGGGNNHRMGLYDAILIKENHILAEGSLESAVNKARQQYPDIVVEAEAENIQEVEQALAARVDTVLLDNFPTHLLSRAAHMGAHARYRGGISEMEATGNIDLSNVRDIADTEVERISIGSLTKNVTAVDLSMRLGEPAQEGASQ